MPDGAPLAAPDARSARRAWIVLATASLAVFAALGLGRFGYAALLPPMQADLGLSNTEAGALASWNLGAYVVVAVAAGLLSTRVGARRLVAVGLLVAGIAMVATGLAGSMVSASAARAATGIGAGMTNVPAVALAAGWFGARRRGMATGVVVSGSSLALVLVGPLVPRVIARLGDDAWRICWYGFGVVALVIAVVAWLLLRDPPPDWNGATTRPHGKDHGLRVVFRSGFAWRLGIVYFAFGFSYVIYMTFFVKRLTGGLGMTAEGAGTLFMTLGCASLLCGVIWGHVSDVIGRKYALAIVCGIHGVSYAAFALWTSTPGLAVSAVLFGLTAWSVPGIVGAACGDAFGPSLVAAALGFVTLFLGVGQALGPLVGGFLADTYPSFAPSYLLASGVALAGAVAALLLPEMRSAPPSAVTPPKPAPGVANDR